MYKMLGKCSYSWSS